MSKNLLQTPNACWVQDGHHFTIGYLILLRTGHSLRFGRCWRYGRMVQSKLPKAKGGRHLLGCSSLFPHCVIREWNEGRHFTVRTRPREVFYPFQTGFQGHRIHVYTISHQLVLGPTWEFLSSERSTFLTCSKTLDVAKFLKATIPPIPFLNI